jgi:hypothetical protein
MIGRQSYARDTWVESNSPWGIFTRARAICPDGKCRIVRLSITGDTYFSVPATVKYRGKTVSGFITFTNRAGLSCPVEDDPHWVEFVPNAYGKNAQAFCPMPGCM